MHFGGIRKSIIKRYKLKIVVFMLFFLQFFVDVRLFNLDAAGQGCFHPTVK